MGTTVGDGPSEGVGRSPLRWSRTVDPFAFTENKRIPRSLTMSFLYSHRKSLVRQERERTEEKGGG